jgi:hypothetical protein
MPLWAALRPIARSGQNFSRAILSLRYENHSPVTEVMIIPDGLVLLLSRIAWTALPAREGFTFLAGIGSYRTLQVGSKRPNCMGSRTHCHSSLVLRGPSEKRRIGFRTPARGCVNSQAKAAVREHEPLRGRLLRQPPTWLRELASGPPAAHVEFAKLSGAP